MGKRGVLEELMAAGKRKAVLKVAALVLLSWALLLSYSLSTVVAEDSKDGSGLDRLMPLIGGALVEAGQKNWPKVSEELAQFETEWNGLNIPPAAAGVKPVLDGIADAKKALLSAGTSPDAAYQAISRLTKATNDLVSLNRSSAPASKGDGKSLAGALLPPLQAALSAARQENWATTNTQYKLFLTQWAKAENAIRADNSAAYASIETKITLARIAIQADPPAAASAVNGLTSLLNDLQTYSDGTFAQSEASAGKTTMRDMIGFLQNAQTSLDAQDPKRAAELLDTFLAQWPTVEGLVRTRSPSTYDDIENQMAEGSSYLLSNPPRTKDAAAVIQSMIAELEPYADEVSYSAWDAGLILFREGVEALLIVAALLAFLHRTDHSSQQKWIWSGAATGLLLSGLLAVVLTYTLANVAAGSARELVEGIVGLISVGLMITIGAWLHGKSNVQAWNAFIERNVGYALRANRRWYLFIMAGICILREGAETAIFYIGMAPSMKLSQLLLGMGIALLALIALGVAVVRSSLRIPMRAFFLTATVFIYYLVLKFMGQSVHALQIAGELPSHFERFLPSLSGLGVYPTWETFSTQLLVVLFIGFQIIRIERKKGKAATHLVKV